MSATVVRSFAPQSAAFPPFPALPPRAGVGLKAQHAQALIETRPGVAFLEIHAENYMGDGGPPHARLAALRPLYPLSIHGVGLSIGGEAPLDEDHLDRLARLIARYQPQSFSEHLAWSTHEDRFFNDLLPIAYDAAALARVCDHVDRAQERLGLRMLLENPSTYVAFSASSYGEEDFIGEVVRRTGCGLLLDVSNVMVSAANHGRDPFASLAALPLRHVGEMHLGGYARQTDSLGAPLLVDDHGGPIAQSAWPLYREAVRRCGAQPTLIEWDNDVPELARLLQEAAKADAVARSALRAGAAS